MIFQIPKKKTKKQVRRLRPPVSWIHKFSLLTVWCIFLLFVMLVNCLNTKSRAMGYMFTLPIKFISSVMYMEVGPLRGYQVMRVESSWVQFVPLREGVKELASCRPTLWHRSHLQAWKRVIRAWPCQHLDLRLPACRTWRQMFIITAAQSMEFLLQQHKLPTLGCHHELGNLVKLNITPERFPRECSC